ncbi:helix-turn-helix domain-containing protein [Lentzea californiensis]|uniref:helix-turn-helix domain-containing protein n=1 Tax=Lentzea californiensis TaxID=438851 RepID=UPI0021644DB6|nr:XRE family transcriptional regulator [Lentzea californiensis]
MQKDWEAVAAAINTRMSELGLMQVQVAERSGVSVAGLRLLQKAKSPNAKPRTLAAVSEALGWPRDYLAAVRDGQSDAGEISDQSLVEQVRELRAEVAELRSRVDAVERAGS